MTLIKPISAVTQWMMEDSVNIEDQPIGKIAYGDLECPGTYMVNGESGIYQMKILTETFLTVRIRRFYLNGNRNGKKHNRIR